MTSDTTEESLPIRMCNELVYCPRLFHLEHVQGIFVESADTIEGSGQHERAARRGKVHRLASESSEPEKASDPWNGALPRNMEFTSVAWGVHGRLDMLEITNDEVIAVEAKRGTAPVAERHRWHDFDLPYRAWPPDVAQIGLYMAVLRDAGLPCDEGRIFYRGNRIHTVVAWTDELERFLRAVVTEANRVRGLAVAPNPLQDSPKCLGCSLHGVCLPDEHHALQAEDEACREQPVRRILPGRDDRAVVHVTRPGTIVRKDGEALVVCPRDGEPERVLLKDVAHVALYGPCQVTEQCMQLLLAQGVPVSHHTGAGRLLGISTPVISQNVALRRAQYRCVEDPARSLAAARALVVAKVRNQRTVLRRYGRGIEQTAVNEEVDEAADESTDDTSVDAPDPRMRCAGALRAMQHALRRVQNAETLDILRGCEGEAAASYFAALPTILPLSWQQDFAGRTRRPPRDRVNALLSFGYSLLIRDATAAAARVGLDPMLGFLHTMVPGRPGLALDLVEPFRAAWVDTAILRLLATHGIDRDDFILSSAGVTLTDRGRNALIHAYERRADELTTHPRFGYRMAYRRLLELEARVLGKWLVGEIDQFTPLWTR